MLAINILMGLLGVVKGNKNIIFLVIGGVIALYISYMVFVNNSLSDALEESERDSKKAITTTMVASSNSINDIRHTDIEKVADGVKYEPEELPEDYVDPDYGKIFKFGYE